MANKNNKRVELGIHKLKWGIFKKIMFLYIYIYI